MNYSKYTLTATLLMSLITCHRCMADTSYTVTSHDALQSIIDNCNDSAYNKVTIYMQPGIYQPFSAISDANLEPRYISFVGLKDGTEGVTVESTSGYYTEPAAELRLNGTVSDITFISSHPEGIVNTTDNGAYAVHADYGSMNTDFNNCTFISYQTAAVGMGITNDSEVTFNKCCFENRANRTFGTEWRLGALYAHAAPLAYGLSGAKLKIVDCSYRYPDSAHGWLVVKDHNGASIETVVIA